jgi:hypothetical protein
MTVALDQFVSDAAEALRHADGLSPVAVSQRSGRVYRPGIGPHSENAAVALMLSELVQMPHYADIQMGQFLPYPAAPRQKCDLWIGSPLEWAIEVKMARFTGDNGKPDDSAIKDLLSPYSSDRSAVSDCAKLAVSQFPCSKAILIYGFDSSDRPLDPVLEAFEALARLRVDLGERFEKQMAPLVHPVFASGRVCAWQVLTGQIKRNA